MPRSTATIAVPCWWNVPPPSPLTEKELTPSEPVTVILSDRGGCAAKGHDVDVEGLSCGDGYLAHAHGRSKPAAVFLSTLGRTYPPEAHTLPSARSQGEPLTGRFALGPVKRCAIW